MPAALDPDACTLFEPGSTPPGLCLVILGGGGSNWPPRILADLPTHPHQKIFPQEKNEIYQRGPNLEVDFRYTNFFLASDPPPPRYSINQPLSKGLHPSPPPVRPIHPTQPMD